MGKYLNNYTSTDAVPHGWDVWDGYDNGGYNEYNYSVNTNGVPVAYGSSASDYLTDVLSQKATSFISSAAQQARPFFLEVASFAPHYPSTPAPQYANAAQGALYPQTAAYNAQVTNPPRWLGQRAPLTAAQQQSLLAQYRLRVESSLSVDDMISNIETTLTNSGVSGNTYIVFSSDNGYHMGEYRLLAGKQTAFDTDINVPLVVTGPGISAGSTVNALASSVDLAQTFDAIAGAKVNAKTDGRSLLPVLQGQVPTNWQRAVLIEHHGPDDGPGDPDAQTATQGSPPSYEAVRTLGGLYVRYVGGSTEYYDTTTDPDELDNLGGSAAPAAVRESLKELEHCHQRVSCKNAAYNPFLSSAAQKRLAKKAAAKKRAAKLKAAKKRAAKKHSAKR
jgi:arylsulfatase A-like enzyme